MKDNLNTLYKVSTYMPCVCTCMCVHLYVCAWIYPNTDPEDLWEIIQMKQRISDMEAQIKMKKNIKGNLVRVTHFSRERLDKLKNRSHYNKI